MIATNPSVDRGDKAYRWTGILGASWRRKNVPVLPDLLVVTEWQ